jgi:hypothetical protein
MVDTNYQLIGRTLVEFAERDHEIDRDHVRVDLTLPGQEIVMTHDASLHAAAQAPRCRGLRKKPNPLRNRSTW